MRQLTARRGGQAGEEIGEVGQGSTWWRSALLMRLTITAALSSAGLPMKSQLRRPREMGECCFHIGCYVCLAKAHLVGLSKVVSGVGSKLATKYIGGRLERALAFDVLFGAGGKITAGNASFAVQTTAPVSTNLYTGRRLDIETGLHYFRNCYFDANFDRIFTRDPLT